MGSDIVGRPFAVRRAPWTRIANGPPLAVWGSLVGVLVLAPLVGLLAVSGNLVLAALAAAVVAGPLLLASPVALVWIFLAGALLFVGVVPLFAGGIGSRLGWAVSALGFLLMLLALFRALTDAKVRRNTPAFVWLLVAFVAYTLLNSLVQGSDFYEVASGFKRYHQAIGLVLALAWLGFSDAQIARWSRLLVAVIVVQLPTALVQLVHFVPIREGLRPLYPAMVPVDVVAGTFGSGLLGGGANSGMAAFLVIALGFLIAYRREGLMSRPRFLLMLPFVLVPLALGETKIVVVLLPIVFLSLFWRRLLQRPLLGMLGLVIGSALTVSAALIYIYMVPVQPQVRIADTIEYNFGERGYGTSYLNRTSVLTFWAKEQDLRKPIHTVMGHGLGTAHDVTGGTVARRYPGYGIGLTAVSLLLWEQGLFGTLLFLAAWALALRTALRLRRSATDAAERAGLAGASAALWVLGLYFLYHDLPLENLPYQVFSACMLGYVAWVYRRRRAKPGA